MKKSVQYARKFICAMLSATMIAGSFGAVNAASAYRNGTYEGSSMGKIADVKVSVTVADGRISSVSVTEQNETPSYWAKAEKIINKIVEANGTEGVDYISGATISSEAIKKAVDNALESAVETDVFESGSGTAADPYIIKTADQLAAFSESVDAGESYAGKYIELGADIELNGNWNPIGAEGTPKNNLDKLFAGNFDGKGHTVSGLTIKTEADTPYTAETNVGLFSAILNTATVSGINLKDVDIDVKSTAGVLRAGAVTGDTTSSAVSGADGYARIDNCTAEGSASAVNSSAMVMAGGIVGRAAGNAYISNCLSDVDVVSSVTGNKTAYGAGIVSMTGNETYVANCANRGDITVLTANGFFLYAGGVVGMMTAAEYNCFSAGNVAVGTIAAADAAGNAGILNGALMPAGSGDHNYYASDAVLSHVDAEGSVTPLDMAAIGAGSMNSAEFEPVAMTKAGIDSAAFAETLNSNIAAVARNLRKNGADIALKLWRSDNNGRTVLSDEVYEAASLDTSIFDSGDGSKASPFVIKTADQLTDFAVSLSDDIDYSGYYVELGDNIDVSGSEWMPIGESSYVFNGNFDGKGYTVSGLTIGSATRAKALSSGNIYIGFFSVLGTNAVVKNVNLSNVLVNVSYKASVYAGGIAARTFSEDSGYKGAVIDNCSVDGKITAVADTGNTFVGGIAGYMYKGAAINCRTNVDEYCTVKTGGSDAEVGGIAALANRALVANSYSLGNVYGSANREDEGMAVVSSLVAVNAGYLANCYGNGQHETDDYSVYIGAVSGWITGVGHAYDNYYNSGAQMKIGGNIVDPVAVVGTRVSSGVSDDGMVYTGGVVYNNEGYSAENYSLLPAKLNANFAEFPVELTQFGITNDSLKKWEYKDNKVTFADGYASAEYVQPEAEIVVPEELKLNDGTWYGRDDAKTVVVTIKVENGEITEIASSDGSAEGDAYNEALETAKKKSTYNDKTSYAPADTSKFAGGKGTARRPYLIANEEQLRYVAEAMNEDVDWENVWFALSSDITLTGGEWLPIGHAIQAEINGQKENFSVYPFRGNFDGKGHTVSNITIGSAAAPSDMYLSGLFGLAAGDHNTNLTPEDDERLVYIKNVKLKNVSINVNSRYEANAGGLIGWAQNGFVIDNCSAEGSITTMARESFGRVGGLVGSALRGSITDSYTNVTVNASTETSSVYAGGLVGMTNRSIQLNCYTLGNVTADAESNNKVMVGGLTGMSGGTNVNCYTYGNIESLITTVDVGGINGRSAGIAVDYDCYYNDSASQRAAGKDVSNKAASGTLVGTEKNTFSKTASEMASDDFVSLLNGSKVNMTEILKAVSVELEDMTENNKEGLSHFLFYTGNGSDLNTWAKGSISPEFTLPSVVEEPVPVPDPETDGVIFGDADNNGKLTATDAAYVFHKAKKGVDFKMPIEEDIEGFENYIDVDEDTKITVKDSELILKKVRENDYIFPVEEK